MNRALRSIHVLAVAGIGLGIAACHPVVEPIHGAGGGHSATSSTGVNGGPQRWKGYVENFHFEDGSDNVQITLSGDPPVAKVILGAHPLYPPPTDPNVASPPAFRNGTPFLEPTGITGFEFTGIGTMVTPTRMTFTVYSREQWNAWCALETPIPFAGAPGSYACVPNQAFKLGPPDSCEINTEVMPTPIDCGKLVLCQPNGTCECSATACSGRMPSQGDISFDMVINGSHADGSVSGMAASGTVHLDRQ